MKRVLVWFGLRINYASIAMTFVDNFSQFRHCADIFFQILARGLFPKYLDKALTFEVCSSSAYVIR